MICFTTCTVDETIVCVTVYDNTIEQATAYAPIDETECVCKLFSLLVLQFTCPLCHHFCVLFVFYLVIREEALIISFCFYFVSCFKGIFITEHFSVNYIIWSSLSPPPSLSGVHTEGHICTLYQTVLCKLIVTVGDWLVIFLL